MPTCSLVPALIVVLCLAAGSASADESSPPDGVGTGKEGGRARGLTAVSGLMSAAAGGRVTDAHADAVVKRLALLRKDSGRRGDMPLIAECDTDGDGKVSRAEARAAVAVARAGVDVRTARVDEMVAALDRDSSGSVGDTEWRGFLDSVGPLRVVVEPLVARVAKASDFDRDGSIDLEEARVDADEFARLLLISGGGHVNVEDPAKWMQVVRVVERADADGSLGLSAAEVAGTTVFKSMFASIDADGSGEVTVAELHARASDLARVGSGEVCQTCPLVRKEGQKKLGELECLMSLR